MMGPYETVTSPPAGPARAYGRPMPPVIAPVPAADRAGPPAAEATERTPRASWIAVAAAAALVGGCAAAGWWLTRRGANLHLGTLYPLGGHYRLHLGAWLVVPVAVAVAIARYGPRLAAAAPWRRLLTASFLTAGVWAVALALVAGPAAIAAPLTTQYEYLHDVGRISALDLGTYLRTFTDHIVDPGNGPVWTVHVSGHPPLATLVFVLLAEAGLAQAGWAAALCIVVGASAAPSVLSTIRLLAGEEPARAAAPFVAAAPAALWIATSADAFFTGVTAAGVCALAHAAARRDRRGDALALAGGLLLGAGLFLSYGLVLIAPVAVVVVALQRRLRPLLLGAVPVVAVVAGFAVAGFWWLEGLSLVHRRIVEGGGWIERPGAYFAFANPGALAVDLGPAVAAALPLAWWARRREWRLLAVPAAALLALAVAHASLLSIGEVERIWLPWAVWLLPLPALLPAATRRGWLTAQLVVALVIAATTRTVW